MMNGLIALFLSIIGAGAATLLFLIGTIALFHPKHRKDVVAAARKIFTAPHPLLLTRSKENPILPQSTLHFETSGVLNPGAVVDSDGRVHLFYRAIGADGVSRIGYASSADGVHIDERAAHPVFELRNNGDPLRETFIRNFYRVTRPQLVASGGSFAGTEDPRAVIIDGRIYITFSAFYGWNSLRIAVISLSLDDLRQRRFAFTPPVFLSAPGEVQKNWVLFPEKINGKFALFKGIESGGRTRAQITYLDSLEKEPHPYIESSAAFRDEQDPLHWDTMLRGAGSPPLKTRAGWLVLYHATDAAEPHKYKVGALLLDTEDPSKILLRSPIPLLTPDASYENNGAKAGVVYVCGALVRNDMLMVYYGGSDSVVCAATTPFTHFLTELETNGIRS